MSTSTSQQDLPAFSPHICCRATLFRSRVWQGLLALFLVLVPVEARAQVGREFVTVEAYVGRARVVHLGKILEITQIEYGEPLTDIQKLGKPYRLVFAVSETLRGEEVKSLELVLSLQGAHFLEYMRDHSIEVMLVGGPTRGDSYPDAEIGIEEQGKRVDDERYHFRLLDNVMVPESGGKDSIAAQINRKNDSCRMFTNELRIALGREAILRRARDFAKQHSEILSTVSLRIPNEFGALCGHPNAYCIITLPICPETRTALIALKDDPGLILRRIKSKDEDSNLASVLVGAHKALAAFPVGIANLAAGQSKLTPQAPDSPANWVDSDNGDLSLRLSVKSECLATQETIVVIASIRNNSAQPLTILRPFGDQFEALAGQTKIWSAQGHVKYTGPTWDYVVNKTAFITLNPKEIATDTLDLSVSDFAETAKAGNYAVRYDYEYRGTWDKTVADEGVKGIWHGTICSREVQLKKQAAKVPRPSQEQLFADRRKLVSLAKVLEEKPDDPTAQQNAAAEAIRLAPHMPGDRLVWDVLLKTRTLKDGMSLAEAEELLGPPARMSDNSVGWYFNPQSRHVAPYLHAKVFWNGLGEWEITRR
ncbi:MAG: hypothetical protein ACKV19_03350 [Verrucomicrobiales bacterium]